MVIAHTHKAFVEPVLQEQAEHEADPEEKGKDSSILGHHHLRWRYLRSFKWLKPLLILTFFYVTGLVVLLIMVHSLPPLPSSSSTAIPPESSNSTKEGEQEEDGTGLSLSIPRTFTELKAAREVLEQYQTENSRQVLLLLAASYIFLQTFMLPGAAGINILAGSLYPFWPALGLAAVLSTIGASLNFWLTKSVLKDVIINIFPGRLQAFEIEIRKHRRHLLSYLMFLRLTPVLPDWLVNVGCPLVGVPFSLFLVATAIGHQGVNVLTVQAGESLGEMNSLSELWSLKNVTLLMLGGLVALSPVLWGRVMANRAKKKETLPS